MNYKIIKYSYFDGYGRETHTHYYIKEKRTIFGIGYWKTVTHEVCGMMDTYKETTTFKTQELAEQFVREKLCKGASRGETTKVEVKTIDCEC